MENEEQQNILFTDDIGMCELPRRYNLLQGQMVSYQSDQRSSSRDGILYDNKMWNARFREEINMKGIKCRRKVHKNRFGHWVHWRTLPSKDKNFCAIAEVKEQ